jgi:hypothetical protein
VRQSHFVVAVVCFGLGVALAGGLRTEAVGQDKKDRPQPAAAGNQKWEYRLVTQSLADPDAQAEQQLNKLGAEGFDLAFTIPTVSSGGEGRREVQGVRYVLRRLK